MTQQSKEYLSLQSMYFDDIPGYEKQKLMLQKSITNEQVAHAQLFVGPDGGGVFAMAKAYAYAWVEKSLDKNPDLVEKTRVHWKHNNHPDVNYCFPHIQSTTSYLDHYKTWMSFIDQHPFPSIYDWQDEFDSNSPSAIRVKDASVMGEKMNYQSAYGGAKVMIIWHADLMNTTTSNKLLKLIEEPPANTVLILIAPDEDELLPTVTSRCQPVYFEPYKEETITTYLKAHSQADDKTIQEAVHFSQGNINRAIKITQAESTFEEFEKYFIEWSRSAFMARRTPAVLLSLLTWSEQIASWTRDRQIQFLMYCLNIFREAMISHLGEASTLSKVEINEDFNFEVFSTFVHPSNFMLIVNDLEEAISHVERNGNAKIIFFDLSMKLSRNLHRANEILIENEES